MTARRVVGAVVVVALLGGGVWWQFDSGPLPDVAPSEPVGTVPSLPVPDPIAMPSAGQVGTPRAEPVSTSSADSLVLAVQAVDAFGDPVASASMELWRALGDAAPFQVGIADARGEWRVPVRDAGVFVRARADGVGDSVRLRVEPAAASAAPIALMLLQAVPVRGLVLGGDGAPLRDVAVKVEERWQSRATTGPNLTAESLRTDGDGRFVFDCVVGTAVELEASSPDGVAHTSVEVTQPCEVLLACPGAFRIDGTFVDAAGRPVEGTASAIELVDPFSGEAMPWFNEEPAAAGESPNTFSLALVEPGRHVVHAMVPGHRVRPVEVFLSLQERRRAVVCVAHPVVETRGVVVDARGAPVGRVCVVAKPDDVAWGDVAAAVEDGAFVLPLVAATGWTLSVQGGAMSPVRCRAGATSVRLVVSEVEARQTATLGIDVFAVDGAPPRYVVFTAVRQLGLVRSVDSLQPRGELPRVTIELPATRERWLLLGQDPFARQAGHVWIEPGDRPVRLVLEPLVPFEVTVRRGGKPARAVVVRVEPCGDAEKARVDPTGVARFAGLAHGPAVVRVLHGNAEIATREVVLRPRDFAFLTIDLP